MAVTVSMIPLLVGRVGMGMIVPGGLFRIVRVGVPVRMMLAVVLAVVVSMLMDVMVVAMPMLRVVMPIPMVMLSMVVRSMRMVVTMLMTVLMTVPGILTMFLLSVCQLHIHAQSGNALAHVGRHPQFELVVQPQSGKLCPQVVGLHA